MLLAGSALRGSARPPAVSGSPVGTGVALALPAGGRGDAVAPGGMAAAMNALPCWTRIGGIADGLLAGDAPWELQDDRVSAG